MRLSIGFGRSCGNCAGRTTEDGLLEISRNSAGSGPSGGCVVCTTKATNDMGGSLAIDDFLFGVSIKAELSDSRVTYHLLAKELKSLKCAHRLSASLHVLKHNMGLSTHFACFHSHNVEDRAVG